MLLEQLGYSLERCSSDAGHWNWKFFCTGWTVFFESGDLAFFALTR